MVPVSLLTACRGRDTSAIVQPHSPSAPSSQTKRVVQVPKFSMRLLLAPTKWLP